MRKRWFLILLLSLEFVVASAAAQTAVIKKIVIQSTWGGLGRPARSDLIITREGDHYIAGRRIFLEGQIQALIRAIGEPTISAPNRDNLGVTTVWLRSHASQAGKDATYVDYSNGSQAQMALFRSSFVDERKVERRLDDIYKSFHTDDNPQLRFEVTFEGGTTLSIWSRSQHPFMIPWCITLGNSPVSTYNIHISRALIALLPEKFTNRERLSDEDGLIGALAGSTGIDIETEWEAMGAQERAGDALEVLKRNFTVRRSEVNSYHDLAFGKEWKGGDPQEENLQVDLWRSGLPSNVVIATKLLRKQGKVEGAGVLSGNVSQYEQLVHSVGWLTQYWITHPTEDACIFYVHDRSLTDKAMRIFSADMKEAGRIELIQKVKAVQHEAALVETGTCKFGQGDYWIVLPDKSAILWRWQSMKHVLGWKPEVFPMHECSEYGTVTGGCSGTVISPSGAIVH